MLTYLHSKEIDMTTFNTNDVVTSTKTGKTYRVSSAWIDSKPRAGVDWTGQEVVRVQVIDEAGKGRGAKFNRLASEFTK
jgi:hypothetical protein